MNCSNCANDSISVSIDFISCHNDDDDDDEDERGVKRLMWLVFVKGM